MAIESKNKRLQCVSTTLALYEAVEAIVEPEGMDEAVTPSVKATVEPDGMDEAVTPLVKATVEHDGMDEAVTPLVQAITDAQEPKSRKPNKGMVYD